VRRHRQSRAGGRSGATTFGTRGDPRGRLPHEPATEPVQRHLLQRRRDRRWSIPATDCVARLNPRPEPNQRGCRWGVGRTCEG
jgi:hypothetical protein